MASRIVTCPHTERPERIDYQIHPLGILIDACSRFCPTDRLACPRSCAARLDAERRGVEDATKLEVPLARVLEVRSLLRGRG